MFATAGMGGGAGIPGRFVEPMPGDGGRFGIAGAPGGCDCDCGPTPGGSPPGIRGKPGDMDESSVTGLSRTKLRLFGKSKVNSPELRSSMFTEFGQLVAVISTRKKFVPTV